MKPLQNLTVKLMMKTVIYMMGLLCVLHIMMTVWKVYYLVTFFSEEDKYENEDKYSLEHDTSDEDSLIPDKNVDEESWTFMGNPVCDMNKVENNEPETFDGFVNFSIYGISKRESMDHVTLGNFDMKKENTVYPHDQSETYIDISNADKENSISAMGNPSHLT